MRNKIIAAAFALALGGALPLAATPAAAGGGFSFQISPNGETADMVRMGLQVYSMIENGKSARKNQGKNRGKVSQNGRNNGAAIGQGGRGNLGYIDQRGRDHSATLNQQGNNGAFAIIQSGRGAQADVVQRGDGDVGLLFQHGW